MGEVFPAAILVLNTNNLGVQDGDFYLFHDPLYLSMFHSLGSSDKSRLTVWEFIAAILTSWPLSGTVSIVFTLTSLYSLSDFTLLRGPNSLSGTTHPLSLGFRTRYPNLGLYCVK